MSETLTLPELVKDGLKLRKVVKRPIERKPVSLVKKPQETPPEPKKKEKKWFDYMQKNHGGKTVW